MHLSLLPSVYSRLSPRLHYIVSASSVTAPALSTTSHRSLLYQLCTHPLLCLHLSLLQHPLSLVLQSCTHLSMCLHMSLLQYSLSLPLRSCNEPLLHLQPVLLLLQSWPPMSPCLHLNAPAPVAIASAVKHTLVDATSPCMHLTASASSTHPSLCLHQSLHLPLRSYLSASLQPSLLQQSPSMHLRHTRLCLLMSLPEHLL